MKTLFRCLTIALTTAAVLLGAASKAAVQSLQQRFSEAQIFLELNDTDEDLGLHASIDGEPWAELKIIGPGGLLLDIFSREPLRTQGLTQVSFESAEPSFDELSPAGFFRRFPEGRYSVSARTESGGRIRGSDILSHVLAAPTDNVLLNGIPAADNCGEPPPTVSAPVTIDWDPVTESHPRVGKRGEIRIKLYQLFVEGERAKLAIDLPPTVTEFEVPSAVTDLGEAFKFEIIARTSTGNNTAIESCFRTP